MNKFLKSFIISTILFSTLFLGMNVFAIVRTSVNANNQIDPYANNPIVTVKGGLSRVIDSATGDIARTTSGWIEDEKYGVYSSISNGSAEFDTLITRTGTKTIYLETTTGNSRFIIGSVSIGSSLSQSILSKYAVRLKPSTSYKLKAYVKYANKASATGIIFLHEHSSDGTRLAQNNYEDVTGTVTEWTEIEVTFTTNASTVYGVFGGGLPANGIGQTFSCDVNSMTLEEVSTITNSEATPVLYYPKATAVSSNDNIDQSLIAGSLGSFEIGNDGLYGQKRAQSFTPTKTGQYSFTFLKRSDVGSPTSDIVVSIQTITSGEPSGTIVGTPVTITSAQWDAISNDAEKEVVINFTPTIGEQYAFVLIPSTQDGSNYRRIGRYSAGGYSGGTGYNFDGTSWAVSASDMYFKTLYTKNTTNFKVRTDTEEVTYTAPTTDGWEDGAVIDTKELGLTPLTLQPGSNNIYFSSNGPETADGTVDASLQAIIQPFLYRTFLRLPATNRLPAVNRLPAL